MTQHNITGVRGNHDQKVVEWRAWIEWIESMPAGRKWLAAVESKWQKDVNEEIAAWTKEHDGQYEDEVEDETDPEDWVKKQKKKWNKTDRKWWDKIPEGWEMFSDHYKIARCGSIDSGVT